LEGNFRALVRLEASVAPSEDVGKVQMAVENVIGDCARSIEKERTTVKISSSDIRCLARLHDQLRDRRIRAAARRLLTANRVGDATKVMLNRQAAFQGVVALCGAAEESSLGPIYLQIESRELGEVIEWLTAYSSG